MEEPSPLLASANAVHHALERFFGLPLESRGVEVLHRALRSVWREHCPSGTFADVDEEARFGQEALASLSAFAERFDVRVAPLAREQWCSTRLPNGVEIFGRLDRVDLVGMPAIGGQDGVGGEHAVRVIDYKTGRRRLAEEDLPGESAAQVYLLLAEAAFGRPVESIRFLYLGGDPAEVCWYPEREDVEAVAERLLELTSTIAADTEFEPAPGSGCRWCAFALACPERQQVALDELVVPADLAF